MDHMYNQSARDLRFLVDKLNEVLNKNLTLVAFDELSEQPPKLIGLLNEVVKAMTNDQLLQIPQRMSKETQQRIPYLRKFFYKILNIVDGNVKPAVFIQGLINGNKQTIFPLLYSLLQNFDSFKIRVYLAKYVMQIHVPPDFAGDEEIQALHEEYSKHISEFKKVHKTSLGMKKDELDPETVKQNIIKLNKQKAQLQKRLTNQTVKIKSLSTNWEKLIEIADGLRDEREKEKENKKSNIHQKIELENKQEILEREKQSLHEMESKIGNDKTLSEMIGGLEEEINKSKAYYFEELTQQLHSVESQISAIDTLQHKPTDIVYDELEKDIQKIMKELEETSKEIRTIQNSPKNEDAEMLSIMRTNVIYKRKKKEKEQILKGLLKSYKDYDKQETDINVELKKYKGEVIPTKEEFIEYKNILYGKIARTKTMKAELSALVNENVILKGTIDVLKTKHPQAENFLKHLRQQDIKNIRNELVNITKQTQDINEKKARTLEVLSRLVEKQNIIIGGQKEKYRPIIEQVRRLTKEAQNLEQIHNEKRAVYENCKVGYESEKRKLQNEIKSIREDLTNFESLYHGINSQLHLMEIENGKIQKEKLFLKGEDKLSEEHDSYTSLYKTILKVLEKESDIFIEQQKEIQKKFEPHTRQIEMFESLKRILEVKIHHIKNPIQGVQAIQENEMMKASVRTDGVDSFVLN